jgi:hypothetical protein
VAFFVLMNINRKSKPKRRPEPGIEPGTSPSGLRKLCKQRHVTTLRANHTTRPSGLIDRYPDIYIDPAQVIDRSICNDDLSFCSHSASPMMATIRALCRPCRLLDGHTSNFILRTRCSGCPPHRVLRLVADARQVDRFVSV